MSNIQPTISYLPSQRVAEGVMRSAAEHYGNHGDFSQSQDEFLEQTVFMVTISPHAIGNKPAAAALTAFEQCYYLPLLKRMFGWKYLGRYRNCFPIAYAFVDFAGTRTGQSAEGSMPHVHAILFVQPSVLERFEKAKPSIQIGIDAGIKKYSMCSDSTRTRPAFDRLVTYCMKGYARTSASDKLREDLWTMFPSPRQGKITLSSKSGASTKG